MEGERAFVQHLAQQESSAELLKDDPQIAFKYSLGAYKTSRGWEPLGPADYYDTFGPELSFAKTLRDANIKNIAIAKFTHSGSQIIDWTPEGSVAKSRNLYAKFIGFVKESVEDLQAKGHEVELAGVFYHVGENDMSWGPFRKGAPQRVMSLIKQSVDDLRLPKLIVRKPMWYVSQQPPTDDKRVNEIDVTSAMEAALGANKTVVHIKAFDLPKQEKKLVIDAKGIVWLGTELAKSYLQHKK